MLRLIPYKSIHDIESDLWDSLVPPDEIYQKHDFICLLEGAKENGTDHWYVLIYKEGLLVATACIIQFRIELDCLMQGNKFWIKKIRRFFKNFMTMDVLICGLPISLGQRNIVIRDRSDTGDVIELISTYMKKIAKRKRIKHLFFKEFSEDVIGNFKNLSDHGFIRAFSLPYMEMDVHWDSFEEYLKSLKHKYRRKIRKGLAKLNIDEKNFTFDLEKLGAHLNSYNKGSAKEFYRGYLAIMARASNKLEVLSYNFFKLLFRRFQHKMDLLEIRNGKEVLASGILIKEGDGLFFMLCGLPEAKNQEFDPYFNLLYAIVNLAIKRRCSKIYLGQTAYWSKQQIGGYPKQRFIYYHSSRKIIHYAVNKFKSSIFPQIALKEVSVFNCNTPIREEYYAKMI
ncbi:MAG: GNAT family N-acetyltransferase [Flavobacteriaceae bacterium]|nr:GNAT family N-acetyltransferase [Eudoraea sp.]NNL16882.1 GNAT family N-acetyltransferase [Flavobacteriaceae bacterium]